ncbi:DUF4062 domain-containing protein [Peribacillus alkalitolerans]|uniref:DUF4062 domain-containing protein n=1 Tax=Peribacillus alkalitolerans TaxID=1550385 RepID=UPI0013D6CEE7|nr:DUF4062 domain-containing protein [Peribacillus alkalitolerans]
MINKTRIFISSAYEEALKQPRKHIKHQLENSGHEVPIFEHGDWGTWEKDTLKQCLEVVKSSDVYVLLINKSASAGKLLKGNVTPTFKEYKAAVQEKKHILVFVSHDIKSNFMTLHPKLKSIHEAYVRDFHRKPDSPLDPFEDWIKENMEDGQLGKKLLEVADPFVWAFLFEIYSNGHWLYDIDISQSKEEAKKISDMLSTSLRSVVHFISKRDEIELLQSQAIYLLRYAEYTLSMLAERNLISNNPDNYKDKWSNLLEQGISFLKEPKDVIQARDFNPTLITKVNGCYAASLYNFDEKSNQLRLVGTAGDITAHEMFFLDEKDVFVVDAFNTQEKVITYREEKQTLYITEPIGDSVLCLHFYLAHKWSYEKVIAHIDEIEYAIMNEQDYFYGFLKLLIGGRTL